MASGAATSHELASRPSGPAGARVGALVLGGDYQGLGIARSLGRRGIPVVILDDERSIARHSRYTKRFVSVPSLRTEEEIVGSLLEQGERLGLDGWVVYPTRDEMVAAISQQRERLLTRFRVPTPGWEAIRWVWDKRNTYALAAELGIPAPRTWYPETLDDLDRIEADPPFAIKPAVKERFVYATKAKAWRAGDRDELRRRAAEAMALLPPGETMVQELIPGGGGEQLAYCAFYRDGEAIGSMTVCRRRQHPPEFGRASTFVETVDEPLVEEHSRRFLDAIGHYGLVELEYKRDPRDGELKLLDVNARTWGYHTLGAAAGVDFPYLQFCDQTGREVRLSRGRVGTAWIRLLTDLPTAAVEARHGTLDWRSYLRSLRRFDTEAVFSSSDPLPGLVEVALIPYLAVKRGF